MAKIVYEELAYAHETKGTEKAVVKALLNMGRIAAQHTRGKVYT